MPDYYVCTYGNFEERPEIIEESFEKNVYMLHVNARYPSALKLIKRDDMLLLKNGSWIIAYGIACGPVTNDKLNNWGHQVQVSKWIKCNPPIHAYGIAWNTLHGGAMSLVKQVVPEWAWEKLNQPTISSIDDDQVCCRSVLLPELLGWKLTIPDYQRGYCWRIRNVLDLLEDIHKWQNEEQKGEYHLGSVILKKSEDKFDIIDGQQRLTTLAIWAKLKNNKPDNIPPLLNSELRNNNLTEQTRHAILRAKETIKNCTFKINFSRIILSVVVLGENLPEDLAYTFFSNSNSTGKRLSDYDLLKTHHLRYVKEEWFAQKVSVRWHNLEKSGDQDELLHQMLFRLRNWRSGNQFHLNAAKTAERDLFNHYAVNTEPLSGFATLPTRQFRFDSILSGGRDFFDYTEHYRKALVEFNNQPVIQELHKALRWHSNGVIHAGIKAAAFLFYCKFGEFYLADAVYALAYRLSILRNETRVMGKYLSGRIFQECTASLDRVTSEGEFLAIMLNRKEQYNISNTGNTAKSYWNALENFLGQLEKEHYLSIPQDHQKSSLFKIRLTQL